MKKISLSFVALWLFSSFPAIAMNPHERETRILYICKVFGALKLNTIEIGKPISQNAQGVFISRYLMLLVPVSDALLQKDFDFLVIWLKSQLDICQNHEAGLLISYMIKQGNEINRLFGSPIVQSKDSYDNITLSSSH